MRTIWSGRWRCIVKRREQGDFEDGIEIALSSVLVNPKFLFRVERDPSESRPKLPTASAIWNWRLGCRFSCGAAFRTTSCWIWLSEAD